MTSNGMGKYKLSKEEGSTTTVYEFKKEVHTISKKLEA